MSREPWTFNGEGECRDCGGAILWLRTPNGKNCPVDVLHGSDLTLGKGDPVPEDLLKRLRERVHWETCPKAKAGGNGNGAASLGFVLTVGKEPAGKRYLCRVCGNRDELGCSLTNNGGEPKFVTVLREDLKATEAEAVYSRDFTQACAGFTRAMK